MAMLQVVINPLTRATGGEGHFSFFSVMGQLVFGLALFVSPLVFSILMQRPGAEHQALVWVQVYWAFLLVFLGLIALTAWLPLPRALVPAENERVGGFEPIENSLRIGTCACSLVCCIMWFCCCSIWPRNIAICRAARRSC